MIRRSILSLFSIALIACGGKHTPKADSNIDTTTTLPAVNSICFEPEFYPSRIESFEEYQRAIDGYWDSFNFEADTLVTAYNRTSVIQAFADYVVYIEPQRADSLLRAIIHRAEASRPVLDLFIDVSTMILHDPNSPLRNDEYYIPILEELIESPHMDEYDRIIFEHDLAIARKNRIGETAADFTYTTADGRESRMHDVDARYTLVMFSNPGCNMCADIIAEIDSSPLMNAMIEADQLKILSIYPDEDLQAWRNKLESMPSRWIVAYDKEMKISTDNLYDLRAIPSLYLLDNAKRVIIKDGTNVAAIEAAMSR